MTQEDLGDVSESTGKKIAEDDDDNNNAKNHSKKLFFSFVSALQPNLAWVDVGAEATREPCPVSTLDRCMLTTTTTTRRPAPSGAAAPPCPSKNLHLTKIYFGIKFLSSYNYNSISFIRK
jgi:hypothetical protein